MRRSSFTPILLPWGVPYVTDTAFSEGPEIGLFLKLIYIDNKALFLLRQKSGEVSWALGKGFDVRSYLRDYKKIMYMQGRSRFVILEKGFKLVLESREIKEVEVGTGSAPVFIPKNGVVNLELVSLMYKPRKLSPISEAEIMKELSGHFFFKMKS